MFKPICFESNFLHFAVCKALLPLYMYPTQLILTISAIFGLHTGLEMHQSMHVHSLFFAQ